MNVLINHPPVRAPLRTPASRNAFTTKSTMTARWHPRGRRDLAPHAIAPNNIAAAAATAAPPAPPTAQIPTTKAPAPTPSQDLIVTTFRWPSQLPARHSVAVTGSFNGWSTLLPLTRTPRGDWVRSVALPPGPIQFKFVIDGDFQSSPCERCVSDGNRAYNNHRIVQPTCEFTWPSAELGGSQVMVAGDWSGWGELLPLTVNVAAGTHTLRCCLPPGQYAYQFLVDGQWRLRPDSDTVHTADGHFAHSLKVEMPPAFRIFYNTGWPKAALRVRGLDAAGRPLEDRWTEVALHDTPSRAHLGGTATHRPRWKTAVIPAAGTNAPAALEFYPVATDDAEDRPHGGGAYICPVKGGYKLRSGRLKPFLQANRPQAMLVSDLDGTLVGDGPEADAQTAEFGRRWENGAAQLNWKLVYNTGRSLGQFQGLLEAKAGALPVPDALITAVGTKIFLLDREGGTRGTASGLAWQEDLQWLKILDDGWDLEAVREAGNAAIAAAPEGDAHWLDDGTEHPHRIALSVKSECVGTVKRTVAAMLGPRGVRTQVIVSGNGDWRYVDIVSAQGGKLAALEYTRALFGVAIDRCVAAGDSGNDALMLGGENPAIVVGNAQDELLDWASTQPQTGRLVVCESSMALGVVEGLTRLGMM